MQNKNWYEYQPQIIAGVIGGIAFAAYRLFRGAAIGAAAGQGGFDRRYYIFCFGGNFQPL